MSPVRALARTGSWMCSATPVYGYPTRSSACAFGFAIQMSRPYVVTVAEADGAPGSAKGALAVPVPESITVTELFRGPLMTIARPPMCDRSPGVAPLDLA